MIISQQSQQLTKISGDQHLLMMGSPGNSLEQLIKTPGHHHQEELKASRD